MKIAALLTLSTALCQAAPQWGHGGSSKKAIYFLRVDSQGSSIVSIAMNNEGKLVRQTSVTSTGGKGLQSVNYTSPTLANVPFDPLQGQNSVTIGGNYLFTVNSGSDTAVMMAINSQNPTELSLIGEPVATLGEFPMSVAYSAKYNKACVLNGGAKNGVACYSVTSKGLIPDGVGLRSFGFNATTPPQLFGPSGSGSDLQFSTDSSKLISVFKGTSTTLGHVSIFDVSSSGAVSPQWTDNQVSPIAAPFGFALGPNPDQFYISDVAFGGGNLVELHPNNKISVLSTVNSTSFAASCWAVWASSTNSFYQVNAGSPNFGAVSPAGSLTKTLSYNSALEGGFDTAVDGTLAYFLTHLNSVAIINLQTGKLMQRFEYATQSNRPFWTGMAVYPS